MTRVSDLDDSKITEEGLKYILKGNNSKISDYLFEEQKGFCAYTETFLGRSDKQEIDHFDPTLKGKDEDGYHNWFLIKAQWNSEKSNKWINYQPILHPASDDFDKRIIYSNGDYLVSDSSDYEAKNLVALLKLDDPDLAIERKRYINRKRDEIKIFGCSENEYFKILIGQDLNSIRFIRAIYEEFGIDVLEMID
jgi:hypothetical protein